MDMVAGFLFYKDRVVLVKKTKPEWQAGLLNGIGGKIEPGESPFDAMVREFEEETGYRTLEWEEFAVEIGPVSTVYFFRTQVDECPPMPHHNDVGEQIISVFAYNPPHKVVGNLRWLVPMALDWRAMEASIVVHNDIRTIPSW